VSVALPFQHATRVRLFMLWTVPRMAAQHLRTLSYKRHNLPKKVYTYIYNFIFSTTFVWNISHSKRIQQDVIYIYIYICVCVCVCVYIYIYIHLRLYVNCPLCLLHNNKTWIFSRDFQKIFKFQNTFKSVQKEPSCITRTDRQTDRQRDKSFPVRAELFYADGQTDRQTRQTGMTRIWVVFFTILRTRVKKK